MKIIKKQDIDRSFQFLKVLNEFLPKKFPKVALRKYRIELKKEKLVIFELKIGVNVFSFVPNQNQDSFYIYSTYSLLMLEDFALLFFVLFYKGQSTFIYLDPGVIPLEFKPKYFVDYYLGHIRSKKRIRKILEHLLIPKIKIDEMLKSREVDKYRTNRQKRGSILKDPKKVLEIISTFRKILPSMFPDELRYVDFEDEWRKIANDKDNWGEITDDKKIKLKGVAKMHIHFDKKDKSLKYEIIPNNNLDFAFTLLINFAQRYKCEPNHLIVIGGIPYQFKFENFLKKYGRELDKKKLRELMRALGCKKHKIENIIYKHSSLLGDSIYQPMPTSRVSKKRKNHT